MLRTWARRMGAEGIYRRLRASALYEVYLHTFRRDLIRERHGEIEFYRTVLAGFSAGDRIFDVGANEGHKTEVFRAMGAEVIAMEPDRANATHLRGRFRGRRSVKIVPKAASRESGHLTFNVFGEGSALNTLSDKWVDTLGDTEQSRFESEMKPTDSYEVETTTLDAITREFGTAFYIKIDVEGHEAEAIEGLSQVPKYLSFELNLPEFLEEGLRCIELLKTIDDSIRFNFAIRNQLEAKSWLSAEEFAAWLAKTKLRYMEVYVHNPNAS